MANPHHEITTEPIHNIKSVSEKTGIAPVTLRAWERRYGFPKPHRTETGYRLYSEYDIAALNWLKLQTESGLSIGQAVKLLNSLIESGQNPISGRFTETPMGEIVHQSIEQIQPALVNALVNLDEDEGNKIIRTAFNLYPIEAVLLEVISPTMVEIGERWHAGEISVAVEHFATHQLRVHLINALEATNEMAKKGRIIAACAPGEWHEIGLLMLTVMLRWRGWAVTYLGANLSLERLGEAIKKLNPQLLLFSATRPPAAEQLLGLTQTLDGLPHPKPIIGLGGRAFLEDPTLTNRIPGTFMGPTADEAIQQIERLLHHMEKEP